MVGGGKDAFIGGVHRIAARLDGQFELVAGALSSRADIARESGQALGLADDRIYIDYAQMAAAEATREDGIDAVAIVTPNNVHYPAVRAFLEAGINVSCDKPLTSSLGDARALAEVAAASSAKFMLTHNYTGYPLMRQARQMVAAGELGTVRVVQSEYPQDWLTQEVRNKQADWRVDPERAGAGGCIGDIGTHAYNLARFVTGLPLAELSADLTAFVPGRRVDDNVNMLLRFANGARGALWASQVSPGNENGLALRVYGDKGGLEWVQAQPNRMWFSPFGKPRQLITRGGATPMGSVQSGAMVRIPPGHPEGYLEAFATLYAEFAEVIRTGRGGEALPTIEDGVEGMA
ncbi:MAG TPA: Gfo/Idh/MocA family oxidoreductase, partial [Devosiaceae bacterium]|nr:Gfo/Idh/MocA family oxidoreductase [Devosiaceae bacterium]